MANQDALHRAGICHPETGRNQDGNHSELAWSISQDPRSSEAVFQQALDEIRQSNRPVIFISGEEFEYLQSSKIAELRCTLKEFDVRIILSLRSQHEVIRSQYGEWLKQFLTVDDFSVFWRFHKKLIEYDFVNLWKNWVDVFGAENVQLLSHAESRTLPHGMISSIMGILGLEEGGFRYTEDTNQSDPAEVIYLWRYMLLKLQTVTGRRFSVCDRGLWEGKHELFGKIHQNYGSIIGATRRMYMTGNYKVTKFQGYSSSEINELQAHFAPVNRELFRIAGRQLWDTTQRENDLFVLPHVPMHAVRKADDLFFDIIKANDAKT